MKGTPGIRHHDGCRCHASSHHCCLLNVNITVEHTSRLRIIRMRIIALRPLIKQYSWECWRSIINRFLLLARSPTTVILNSLRPRQNGRHFADDIFNSIFLNDNARISLKIPLKFVPKVRINNIPALVQIMAWRRPGDKPLSEPMMVSLLTYICVTRPQWVNSSACICVVTGICVTTPSIALLALI